MIRVLYSTARSRVLKDADVSKQGAWVHAVAPTESELDQLAGQFELDRDLLNDAIDIYESPRVEEDNGSVYLYTRYCFPEGRDIATEPLLIIYQQDRIITVMRTASSVFDRLLGGRVEAITTHRTKFLLHILEEINLTYRRQLMLVGRKILSIRAQLKKTEINNEVFVSFIDLEEDLNEFLAALQPQASMLKSLVNGRYLRLYEEDRDMIEDLTLSTAELIELSRSRLKTISNTREAYSTIMANTLNKTFKRLTSISIFMTIPTITAGLYGMNLSLPLAKNANAFWFILIIVMAITAITIWVFQKKRWL